ncbi:MAG: hypothetical protein HYR71_06800 [Chloroflexi bacterium]|nr:hypothetical protein [Chloroflexota bacterium]
MSVELIVKSTADDQLVRSIVRSALDSQAEIARLRYEQFQKDCVQFETRFQMSSEEFVRQFDSGTLGDAADYFDWYAAVRGRDVWRQKAQVLAEVSI